MIILHSQKTFVNKNCQITGKYIYSETSFSYYKIWSENKNLLISFATNAFIEYFMGWPKTI